MSEVTKQPRFKGVFPVVPTTFNEDGELDLDSQRRCLDFMIDAGSNGLCILANFSEQFVLTDHEREVLTDLALDTRGRARAGDRDHVAFQHARVRRAQQAGASGGRCDGDGDAALPRGNHSCARGGDLRILQQGLGGDRHPDHDPGRAGERHPVVGRLPGAHGARDPERRAISRSRWPRQRPSCAR